MAWVASDFLSGTSLCDTNYFNDFQQCSNATKASGGKDVPCSNVRTKNADGFQNVRSLVTASTEDEADDDVIEIIDVRPPAKRSAVSSYGSKRTRTGDAGHVYEVSGRKLRKSGQLWIDKYMPVGIADLAVNKKKIVEVQKWMENLQNSTHYSSRILILTGPPGAGKSVTARLAAKDLHIDVVEWENPVVSFVEGSSNTSYESQETLLKNFLLRSKYKISESVLDPDAVCKQSIAIIEDIPYFCIRNPDKLWELLNEFNKMRNSGLIIIFTENFAGNALYSQMFPPNIIDNLRITTINFNAVTKAALRKVLRNILNKEALNEKTFEANLFKSIDDLIDSSNGDIRSAISSLQFNLQSNGKQQRKCKINQDRKAMFLSSKPDASLILFRAVGRVFYVKRDTEKQKIITGLPEDLLFEARNPLLHDPEEIVERCTTNTDTFVSFLHENYPYFIQNMEKLETAAELFSLVNLMASDWTVSKSISTCASSAAVRGLMHLHDASPSTKKPKFHSICKPSWTAAKKKMEERMAMGRTIRLDCFPSASTSTVFSDIFPFAGKIVPLSNSSATNMFLNEMAFAFYNSVPRESVTEHGRFADSDSNDAVENEKEQPPLPSSQISVHSVADDLKGIDISDWTDDQMDLGSQEEPPPIHSDQHMPHELVITDFDDE